MGEKSGLYPTDAMNAPPPPYSVTDPNTASAPQLGFDRVEDTVTPVQQPVLVQPIVQQVVTVPTLAALGAKSVHVTCPHCQADQNSSIIKTPSVAAYVSAVCLFILGCAWGCCLIPFCMDSCQTTEHRCANCRKFLGKYSKY